MGEGKTSLHASCLEGIQQKSYSLLNENYHVLAKSEHFAADYLSKVTNSISSLCLHIEQKITIEL